MRDIFRGKAVGEETWKQEVASVRSYGDSNVMHFNNYTIMRDIFV